MKHPLEWLVPRIVVVALVVAIAIAIGGCGGAEDGGGTDLAGSVNVSGGIAGLDDTWLLSGGVMTLPDGSTVEVSSAFSAALRSIVERSGFFALDDEYLPDDPCCDRFTYVVTIELDGRRHDVTTADGVDAPTGVMEIVDLFRSQSPTP